MYLQIQEPVVTNALPIPTVTILSSAVKSVTVTHKEFIKATCSVILLLDNVSANTTSLEECASVALLDIGYLSAFFLTLNEQLNQILFHFL